MEKRTLLAFALSVVVLMVFQLVYRPQEDPPTAGDQLVQGPGAGPGSSPGASSPDIEELKSVVATAPPAGELRAEKGEELPVETSLYSVRISNTGGVLKSFKLKTYTDAQGQPIELIDEKIATQAGWPLTIVSGDTDIDAELAKADFVVNRQGDDITLEFASGGLYARKILRFSRENYELALESSLTRGGKWVPHSFAWQGGFGDQSIPFDPAKQNVVYNPENSFERLNLGSMDESQEFVVTRAGIEDQYFLVMFLLPGSPVPVKVQKEDAVDEEGKAVTAFYLAAPVAELTATRIYIGPKDKNPLRKADAQLISVIDYGIFEFITRPLIVALLWIHSYIGNFGWAIIILTIIINFVLFPLRLKQQVSMKKMQKVQPHMRTLQDRYKKLKANDPKRAQIQSEMMGLYREHGVNPMGGCLPLVLQMPFLFAFWNMLSVSIELRQAPWMLWIQDLSRHDPYYILPLLMAASMILMQKMTPTTVDPAQAKIMMIMPVMLTVMFLWVQSGLMLYWLTSNLVGIGQQFFINRYWSGEPETALARVASRKERR
jgi:YidC/Oxa1 family membrane protein insertase